MSQQLSVRGMTCENCAKHVREALSRLPGVRSARVDLASESALLDAARVVPDVELRAALEEEGYELG